MSKALCAYRANEGVVSGNKAETPSRHFVDALLGEVLCRVWTQKRELNHVSACEFVRVCKTKQKDVFKL